jgi:hypothetical protein
MSRTITLIAAVGAALAVAVPSAWGTDQPDARSEGLNRLYGLGEYSPEMRALMLRSQALNEKYGLGAYSASTSAFRDAHERLPDAGRQVPTVSPDAFERAVAARNTGSVDRFIANDNRFRVEPASGPVTVAATGSGSDVEWPQIGIGIGLGIGIALMLGLMLGLRVTRHRPLAH